MAQDLIRIANDFRLLASGPSTGLDELRLPSVQPGSSIMPGKVNPVLAEMLDMACFHVLGHDLTVTLAAQAGQLELNMMMPIIAHELFEMMHVLIGAAGTRPGCDDDPDASTVIGSACCCDRAAEAYSNGYLNPHCCLKLSMVRMMAMVWA